MRYIIKDSKTDKYVEGFRDKDSAVSAMRKYRDAEYDVYLHIEPTVKEKEYVFPVIRDFDRAMDKLYYLKENDKFSPMQYVNWFCSFCCPHLKEGTTGFTCKRDTCIFGRMRRKFFEKFPEYDK